MPLLPRVRRSGGRRYRESGRSNRNLPALSSNRLPEPHRAIGVSRCVTHQLVWRVHAQMTIYCKLCNHRVSSRPNLEADKSEEGDCLESLSRHLVSRHPAQALELKNDLESLPLLIATYLLIKGFATIPPESGSLKKHFEENEQLLLEMFADAIQAS